MFINQEWDGPRNPGPRDIYEVESALTVPLGQNYNRREYEPRSGRRWHAHQRDSTEITNALYRTISLQQGILIEGGPAKNDYYQTMGEMNYPADEQFRKESQIMKNRVERDKRMRMKKNDKDKKAIKIKDLSDDQFVIPCAFPSAMNLKEEEEIDKQCSVPPSSIKIDAFLNLARPENRWADASMRVDGSEDAIPRRDEAIERLMVANAIEAASQLENCSLSICLSFEDYPPAFVPRHKILKTIVIDGCAVMKQINFNFEIPWNPTGGATNTFKGNKLLVMKPLIDLAMRFLLQGHKTVVILPNYYKNPVFAGLRQKVDNVPAFNSLIETGIVHFIEEATIEDMHQKLYEENKKREGTWVSTTDLQRIILKAKKQPTSVGEQREESSGDVRKQKKDSTIAEFTHKITPFFYDNKLVLPLHMSTPNKTILYYDKLLYHIDNNVERIEERSRNQMTMEEQKTILFHLQDVFDLPLKLLRGMMMFRRILKEIKDNEMENKRIADETSLREFEDETQRAFGGTDYVHSEHPNVTEFT